MTSNINKDRRDDNFNLKRRTNNLMTNNNFGLYLQKLTAQQLSISRIY